MLASLGYNLISYAELVAIRFLYLLTTPAIFALQATDSYQYPGNRAVARQIGANTHLVDQPNMPPSGILETAFN